jgi:hypothetical protein
MEIVGPLGAAPPPTAHSGYPRGRLFRSGVALRGEPGPEQPNGDDDDGRGEDAERVGGRARAAGLAQRAIRDEDARPAPKRRPPHRLLHGKGPTLRRHGVRLQGKTTNFPQGVKGLALLWKPTLRLKLTLEQGPHQLLLPVRQGNGIPRRQGG